MNFGQASLNVIQALKTHLRAEYAWYSEKEIEQMVYKFLNEYLAKLALLTSSTQSATQSPGGPPEEPSIRSSLSSAFDFNDRDKIER